MDCSPPGSPSTGVVREWVAIPFSRGSSHPRDQTQVSCTVGAFFTDWASGEAQVPIKWTSQGHLRHVPLLLKLEENVPLPVTWAMMPGSRLPGRKPGRAPGEEGARLPLFSSSSSPRKPDPHAGTNPTLNSPGRRPLAPHPPLTSSGGSLAGFAEICAGLAGRPLPSGRSTQAHG